MTKRKKEEERNREGREENGREGPPLCLLALK